MNAISIMTQGVVCQAGGGAGETIVTKSLDAEVDTDGLILSADIDTELELNADVNTDELELSAEINSEKNLDAEVKTELELSAEITICDLEN